MAAEEAERVLVGNNMHATSGALAMPCVTNIVICKSKST